MGIEMEREREGREGGREGENTNKVIQIDTH